MTLTPHDSRCRRRSSKISGKAESSAMTLAGSPRHAIAAATASLLPTWPATTIAARPDAFQPSTIRSTPAPSTSEVDSPCGRDGSRISSTMYLAYSLYARRAMRRTLG